MTKKICLIGSAPSSVALAPYADPSWDIWGCSPGARPYVRKVDKWFEIHKWEPEQPWFSQEYIDFMAKLPVPVYMLEPVEAIPGSVPYPKDEVMRYFGPEAIFFYTSSLSWMFAMAIIEIMNSGEDGEIALYGVDMSAAEEQYTGQRAGCQYFTGQAWRRGIKVTVPPQSDLLCPTPLYGFCELDPMHAKLLARKAELEHRIAIATNAFENAKHEMLQLRGAVEDVNYVKQTWVTDRVAMDILKMGETVALPRMTGGPIEDIKLEPGPIEFAPDLSERKTSPTTWGSTPEPRFINGL
jgi:hypothetical protein